MAASGPRHGRRDNGLIAAEYAAVGDVDPRVGEHLLDLLGLGGIAAYLQPATDLDPITRAALLPSRPTDRLFVDRNHLDTARSYLTHLGDPVPPDSGVPGDNPGQTADERRGRVNGAGHPGLDRPELDHHDHERPDHERHGHDNPPGVRSGPSAGPTGPGDTPDRTPPATTPPATTGDDASGPDPVDIDEKFASIVAGLNLPSGPGWPPDQDPAHGGHPPRRRRTDQRADQTPPHDHVPPDLLDRSILDGLDTFGADLPDSDAEEGYTPPPPPPLPRLSRPAALALAGIFGGLALFFWPGLLPIPANLALLIGFGGVLSGFITLVWRLRPGDEEDLDPPDGAQV